MPSSVGSSRRMHFEQNKLLKQTIFFVIAAVIALILFIVVIIPGLIRLLTSHDKPIPNNTTTDVTVQTPILSAPVNATSSASITVTGYAQSDEQVVVLDNQQQAKRVSTKSDGSFSADVQLAEGDNEIAAYALTNDNRQSAPSQQYSVQYDKQPPKLDISEPQDQQSIQGKKNQNMTIKGQSQKGAKIYVNDRLVFTKDDGSFTTLFLLNVGQNNLDIKAVDEAGNVTEKKLTVTYAD